MNQLHKQNSFILLFALSPGGERDIFAELNCFTKKFIKELELELGLAEID